MSLDDDDDEPLAMDPSTSRSLPTISESTKSKEVDYVTLDSDDDEALIVPPAGKQFDILAQLNFGLKMRLNRKNHKVSCTLCFAPPIKVAAEK